MKNFQRFAPCAGRGRGQKTNIFMRALATLLVALLFMPSVLAATQATFSTNRTDFRDESIYFVMTTRFYDGDESNNTQCWDNQAANANDPPWRGDFKGLIQKLDYIKALGFTAVWITPVVANASGYDYHGYHAMDFSKVDPRYLSDDTDFQALIDAAHAKGMKIILDIVLQHTGNFGEENLCKLFNRNWDADQSAINECMVPYTKSQGGLLPDNYLADEQLQYSYRLAQMKNTDGVNHDSKNYWHHFAEFNWDNATRWFGQIAGDCVDLNTENPAVYNYIIDCYSKFIAMGVDGFRIDTSGHIPRLTFNKAFIPGFQKAAEQYADKRGGFPFFMYGEVCARETNLLYRGRENLSPFYYTWAETKNYDWDDSEESWNGIVAMEGDPCTSHTNWASVWQTDTDDGAENWNYSGIRTSDNALLDGNDYHTPDYSNASGFSVIDFTLHWNFESINRAWPVAQPDKDKYYNDATWNVVYVDSHDYAPDGAPSNCRFAKGTDAWASNLSLMFTHRGIPCVYYGSEIEFMAGKPIDKGTDAALSQTGRAYYGDHIEGSVTVTDFAQYSGATGAMATTLSKPLAKHIQQLNKIRQAVPALRKGQYSMSGCSGQYAFKRRYTDENTDSYALVTIQGNATFSNILNGTYTDVVSGAKWTVTNNRLAVNCPNNAGNLRVFVLDTEKTAAPGKVVEDGDFIYSVASDFEQGVDDGSTDTGGSGSGSGSSDTGSEPTEIPDVQYTPQYNQGECVAFFEASQSGTVRVWAWGDGGNLYNDWPGAYATPMGKAANGNTIWKWTYTAYSENSGNAPKYLIFSYGSGAPQSKDLEFVNGGYYTDEGDSSTTKEWGHLVTTIAAPVEEYSAPNAIVYVSEGVINVANSQEAAVSVYTLDGRNIYGGSGDCSIPMDNAGIYIVKIGNTTQKVAVK